MLFRRNRKGRITNHSSRFWAEGWDIRYRRTLFDPETGLFKGLNQQECSEIIATFDLLRWLRDPRRSIDTHELREHIIKPRDQKATLAPSNAEALFKSLGNQIEIRRLDGQLSGYYRLKTFQRSERQGSWRAIYRIMEERDKVRRWIKPGMSTSLDHHQFIDVMFVGRRSGNTYLETTEQHS